MTVLVRGTRIEAAGASRSVRIPAGTRVIDGHQGRWSRTRLYDWLARRALFDLAQRAAAR